MNLFLSFSDSAKFADVARNFNNYGEYVASFRFWNDSVSSYISSGMFSAKWISPVTPLSISFFSKIFGVNDIAVIATSVFYYLLTLIFVYLLSNKIYKNKLISVLSVIAVGFNYDILKYALNGASEMPFMFVLLAATYFLSFKERWTNLIGILFMLLMYFTRPQAIIYIFGLIFYYFINNYSWKKGFAYAVISFVAGTILYSMFSKQGFIAITQNLPGMAVSDSLRGSEVGFDIFVLIKKFLYNIYNFYKSLPVILNPYLFTLFIVGIFKKFNTFTMFTLFISILTFSATALTIPFYRYIHPIVPFVYIVGVATLIEIIGYFENKSFWITKEKYLIAVSTTLIILFSVGQTLGIYLLDSRFERKNLNLNKKPVYVEMSYKLKEITSNDEVVLTNLDTWGSWYGERKTVWFPLEPSMVLPKQDDIDAIFLTSYKIDDENYYMGEKWREIFNNPINQKILPEYKFVAEYQFKSDENYEKENGRAVLLRRTK